MTITKDGNWLKDENGNKCSIDYFGSEDAARAALLSLKNCRDCTNCTRCTDCSDCSGCTGCSGCSGCTDCARLIKKQGDKGSNFVVPIIPGIHQKVAQAVTASDTALDMTTWHKCETTHCRAGWIVELAGDEGKALEKLTSTPFAAMQIAKASGLPISPVRFYDTNEAAMKDILATAEKEKAMEAGNG